jgi:hypothetical protein
MRLSMWSGPRNISTAMMRSWGNRPDTIVKDEPLYSHYLNATGKPHPGAAEVIAAGPSDEREAIARMMAPLPAGKSISYCKQMSHHVLPGMDREWMRSMNHAFLIREPRLVIASFVKLVDDPAIEDTGYRQQFEIFEMVRGWSNKTPAVIDARDVLSNPRHVLQKLCEALDIEFMGEMLSWEPGLRATDGVWAKYWYKEVESTTSFKPYVEKDVYLEPRFHGLLDECQKYYDKLYQHRLTA